MGAFSKKWFRRCSRRHYDAYDWHCPSCYKAWRAI
jgi:hypothetical protein